MMDNIDEILNENSVKDAIDELCEDIRDFGELDFVHILWGKKDGQVKGRYYGELDTLLANLLKAQFLLLLLKSEKEAE